MNIHPILRELGLTKDMIASHVVSVDRRKPPQKYNAGSIARMNVLRAARKVAGLNVFTGQPLRRSPNGQRKTRTR